MQTQAQADSVPIKTSERWFYRCRDCLTTVVVEGPAMLTAECAACDGPIETMGRVMPSGRLGVLEHRVPCDARCTHARGPKCECPCGGENHGTGLLVPVWRVAGASPRIQVPVADESLQRAREWREALGAARGERDRLLAEKREQGWLGAERWDRLDRLRRAISAAQSKRTHAGRMRALLSLK